MRPLLCAALLAVFSSARAQEGASEHWDARLTAAAGEVVVHPADGSPEVAGDVGMPLEQGDRVVTSADSSAEIALDGDSLMTLSANSDFTLENTQKSASIFSLTLGSLMAKIQKLGSQSLSVRSPTSVAAVRGTEFGVDVEVGQSHVGVFDEGRVEVQAGGGTEVLTPNQETSVMRGRPPLRAMPLRRFAGRREAMRGRIRRLAFIRRNWRSIPAGQRRAARSRALERGRQHRMDGSKRRALMHNAPGREKPGRKILEKDHGHPERDRDREHDRDYREEKR